MAATIILLIGLLVLGSVGIFLAWRGEQKIYRDSVLCPLLVCGWGAILVGFIAALVIGWLWLACFLTSYARVQDMRAFYHDTQTAYSYAIETTQALVLDVEQTREKALTDLAYQGQGNSAATRIMEFRNKIEWYNQMRRWLIAVNQLPVIGGMYYDLPNDLQPIRFPSPG